MEEYVAIVEPPPRDGAEGESRSISPASPTNPRPLGGAEARARSTVGDLVQSRDFHYAGDMLEVGGDEEQDLQLAILESVTSQEDKDLQDAIALSLGEKSEEDNKALQEAIARSLGERPAAGSATIGLTSKPDKPTTTVTRHDVFVEKLAAIPQLQQLNLGPLFKSSQPAELTESETEYLVTCIKHVYAGHVVLQFDCTNTLADQLLEQVRVELEVSEGWEVVAQIPASSMQYNVASTIYTVLAVPEDLTEAVASMAATLKFTVKDCDPATREPDSDEGYDDEYQLEDLDVSDSSNVRPSSMKIKTVVEAKKMLAKDDVVIFGFGAPDSTIMKTFVKTADKLRHEYTFAHTSAEEVMTKLGQKEGVVLYRPKYLDSQFEDGTISYSSGADDEAAMASWIADNKHGIAGHRTSVNATEFINVISITF